MPKVSIAEAAQRLGVSVQRVHQRISDGSLAAERVGHQWVVDAADLVRLDRHSAGRPLSPRSAWVLIRVAALDVAADSVPAAAGPAAPARVEVAPAPSSLAPPERSRARARLREFLSEALPSPGQSDDELAAANLAASLRSLLRSRGQRHLFRSSPRDLDDLRSDGRLRLSGISLPDSGIASGDIVEGYVADHDLEGLVGGFLLSEARHGDANVVLHVVDPAIVSAGDLEPENWLLLAADLAEHHQPREVARAAQIVREAAAQCQSR